MEHVKKLIVSIQFDGAEMELADYFKIKNAETIIDEVRSIVNNWEKYAVSSGVSRELKNSIQKVICP